MYSFKHAAFDLTPYQQLSNELSWMVKGAMPKIPELGVFFTPPVNFYQSALSVSTSVMLDSFQFKTNFAGLMGFPNLISSWIKSDTESLFKSTQITLKALLGNLMTSCNPALAMSNSIAQLSEQWGSITTYPPDKDSSEEVLLNKDITDKVTEILSKSPSESGIEQESILAKLKSKMSIGDLIGLIGILVSILLFIYGQISSAKDQQIIEEQNQTIIAEEREIEKDIEEKEQYKQTILLTAQQLTDTAQRLESSLPPKESKDDQQEKNIDQENGNSQPKD